MNPFADNPRPEGIALSVVVPTYRRPRLLATCIASLAAQTLDPRVYEIVVCDDGPDDATRAAVEALARRCAARGTPVRYLPITATQGPAGARNAGWRAARGPVVAFTDDDTCAAPDWLATGLKAIERGVDAASGTIEVPLPPVPTDYELDASGLARAEFATANVFVTHAMLERIGGFDERFTSAWREDSDLHFSILEAGGAIACAPDARVVHPVRPARWGVSLAQQRKVQYDALLFKKHPDAFRQRLRTTRRWLYYATLAAALVCIAGLLAGAEPLAWTGFACWVALTLHLCQIRLRLTSHRAAHIAEMVWTSLWIPFLSTYWRLVGAIRYRVWFL
jgi:GT2 family glycosyltransferase